MLGIKQILGQMPQCKVKQQLTDQLGCVQLAGSIEYAAENPLLPEGLEIIGSV